MSVTTWGLVGGLAGLSAALAFLPRPAPEEAASLRGWIYRSMMAVEWSLVALFLGLLLADGRHPADFGLRLSPGVWRQDLLWAAGVSLFAIGWGELWWALGRRQGWSGLKLMQALLPRTRRERWLALGLAVTAGCCEEFLYRGFLVTVVAGWSSNVPLAVGISVVLFALAHAPYGKLGLMSALGGAALAVAFVATGRLTAPILAHIAYDCYAFFWGRFEPAPQTHG